MKNVARVYFYSGLAVFMLLFAIVFNSNACADWVITQNMGSFPDTWISREQPKIWGKYISFRIKGSQKLVYVFGTFSVEEK